MRDIRGDLQDRASLLEDQINAHEAEFEKLIEQLKREHAIPDRGPHGRARGGDEADGG